MDEYLKALERGDFEFIHKLTLEKEPYVEYITLDDEKDGESEGQSEEEDV